jgi:mono/diheme cytochrome c family protein
MLGRSLTLSAVAALALAACGGGGGDTEQEAATPAAQPEAQAPAQPAQGGGQIPAGMTAAQVEEGRTLFAGAGLCFTCHGQAGVGVAQLGPSLADGEWLHSDGSFDAIVNQINKGVTAAESKSGTVMPPKGGAATLTDEQVRSIAAYVYSLRS